MSPRRARTAASIVSAPPARVPKFDGFLTVYEEGKDQKDEEDEELKHKLPAVTEGEVLKFKAIEPEQHFTEPPPRFNEATLVKELEAERRRPALHLRGDSLHDSGTRVRQEGRRQVHPDRTRRWS